MNQSREHMLGHLPIKKLLFKLAIPATFGMVFNALYNLVDTIFVARGVGEVAIGALTFAFPVQMILLAIGLMIGIGSASVYSRAFGRKDYKKMDHAVNTAFGIDIILAIIVMVTGYAFLDDLLRFFGASDVNIGYGRDYLSIILLGLLPMTLSMVLNNLTRAEGRPHIAMITMIIGAGLNIILDAIFIFVFKMGVQGAALATVIAQMTAFTFIFFNTYSKRSMLKIKITHFFKFDKALVKETVTVGFPTFIRNATAAILVIIINRLINRYVAVSPELTISIYGIISRVINFAFMPAFGIIQGLTPIVSFNYGAKNYRRLKEAIMFATKIIMVYFLIGLTLIVIFAPQIFSVFSESNNQSFILEGAEAIRVIAIGFSLVGFQIIVSAIMQAFGYPIRALIVTISRQVIFFIPFVYILTAMYGSIGIWIAFPAADLLAGIVGFVILVLELRSIQNQINLYEQ